MPAVADLDQDQKPMNMSDLEVLARTHAARLASFLRRRVGNPHDVEDLVQDTLLEAVRCLDRFQGQSRPETWLFGIALNLSRNYHKRAKARDIYSDVETDDIGADASNDPCAIAEHRERMVRVATAAEELPQDSSQLLQLLILDNFSYDRVARELGIPMGTVRSRISRVRSHLRRSAEGQHAIRPQSSAVGSRDCAGQHA